MQMEPLTTNGKRVILNQDKKIFDIIDFESLIIQEEF